MPDNEARVESSETPEMDAGTSEAPEAYAAIPDKPAWDSELAEELYRLLYESRLSSSKLTAALEGLETEHVSVYSELLYLLCHLRLEAKEAKQHWQEILRLRDSMEEHLESDVDVRVAIVRYFLEVSRRFENPKLVELKLFEETQAFAYRDELTGLHNYRFFREYLDREVERSGRYRTPISLILLDIDNFKHYNDTHGHEAGNQVLYAIARLMEGATRGLDVPARYGGEEFVIILPSTSRDEAALVAERTRETIERHRFPHEESQPMGNLTVSVGVVTFPNDASGTDELIEHADRAMYVAKAQGKNRVQGYGENRRSHPRVVAELDGRYRTFNPEFRSMTTVDVSERGLLLRTDQRLPVGRLVDITLNLPESPHEITLYGRVIRVREHEGGDSFETAVSVIDIPTQDHILLIRYISSTATSPDDDGTPNTGE